MLCAVVLYYLVCSSSVVWQGVLASGHLFAVEHVYFLCVFMCVLLAVQHTNFRDSSSLVNKPVPLHSVTLGKLLCRGCI